MKFYKNKLNKLVKVLLAVTVVSACFSKTINTYAQENSNDIVLQKKIVSLKLNQVTNINYNSNKSDDRQYKVDNIKVAKIDSQGNIIGKMIGTTTIVGKDNDGNELETIVIVYRDLLEPLGKIAEPRFKLKDGIFVNENAKETNEALLMFTGDLMCQTRQQEAYKREDGTYNFNDSFKIVKDLFAKADLVTGNLESLLSNTSPYMSEEKALLGQPHCNGPLTYLDALKYAGFDALVTANNHITDDGERGLQQTVDSLDRYKFAHTGAFRNDKEQRFLIIDVNGIKVALMSYSEKFNGKDVLIYEDIRETILNRFTKEAVERDVKEAKSMGAEYIIAYNHWGVEYVNEYNKEQAKSAQIMAEAGVDFIIGSHPHALQTTDILTTSDNRKVPVAYSLGNFVSHQYKTVTKDNFILVLNLKRDKDGKVYLDNDGYIPCHVFENYEGTPYLVVPSSKEFNGGVENFELNESYSRIKTIVNGTLREITSYDELKN